MQRILIFILFAFSLTCSAQLRNSREQKMVERIEIFSGDADKPYNTIKFGYDERNFLVEMSSERSNGSTRWKKQGNMLTRKDYDMYGNIDKEKSHSFVMNSNGTISETCYRSIGYAGDMLIHRIKYTYGHLNLLENVEERVYFKEYRKNEVETSDRCIYYYNYDNGNRNETSIATYNWRKGQTKPAYIKWKKLVYSNEINDTNIDIFSLHNFCGSDEFFEMFTEWVDNSSVHLVSSDWATTFEYIFDENEDNINEIIVYSGNMLVRRYRIFYL